MWAQTHTEHAALPLEWDRPTTPATSACGHTQSMQSANTLIRHSPTQKHATQQDKHGPATRGPLEEATLVIGTGMYAHIHTRARTWKRHSSITSSSEVGLCQPSPTHQHHSHLDTGEAAKNTTGGGGGGGTVARGSSHPQLVGAQCQA